MYEGRGFQDFDKERVQIPAHNQYFDASPHWVCQEYSTKREYLFSLLFSMIECCESIDLYFLWHSFASVAIRKVFPAQKDWSTRQQGPPSLISANRSLQMLVRVSSIIHTPVTVLWYPLVGIEKRASRSKCVFVWLPIEQPLLRSVGPDSQCKTDRSAVHHSCPVLLLGETSSGNITFSLMGQHLHLGRIDLSVTCGQALLDVECWNWYPSILSYFSSCKIF